MGAVQHLRVRVAVVAAAGFAMPVLDVGTAGSELDLFGALPVMKPHLTAEALGEIDTHADSLAEQSPSALAMRQA